MKEKHKITLTEIQKKLIEVFTRFKSGPNIYSLILCIIAAIVITVNGNKEEISNLDNFETGKVADRDITAGKTISFEDEDATLLKTEAAVRQVPAVYRISSEACRSMLDSWITFCDFLENLDDTDKNAAKLEIEKNYHGVFLNNTIDSLLSTGDLSSYRNYGIETLNTIMGKGIFSYHIEDTRTFNHDIAELQTSTSGTEKVLIPYNSIITMSNIKESLNEIIKKTEFPDFFKIIAVDLLISFIGENAFFSYRESQRRIEEARETTPPVIKTIEKGKKIIRKGFIITDEEMSEINALHILIPKRDPRNAIGIIFRFLFIYILYLILRGPVVIGRTLSAGERYMLSTIIGVYIIGAVLLNSIFPAYSKFMVSLLIPTALFIMLLAVFLGTRVAVIMSLAIPLGAYFAGAFDIHSFFIALISAITASTVLHYAQSRMAIIKAGLLIALANGFAVIVVLLIRQDSLNFFPVMVFWGAINGIICGMLTLGFLPPLEHALNSVTPFRLMELSDLNAPILKKLFTTAPGTYSHSLMVANLAEQACQDIGANALLARVGAYYHDIGKMENPDYFVENQTTHNKHDELAPRLSATIIRSHVKLGVEKAYSLGLPKDVIDIIAEHHGNSVISWFYNKAMEQEEDVSSEDFTYPGTPPRSKESAVVMLADVTEAAVRTIQKPSAGKMEKFVQQLFEAKAEHGQLNESELSFRDLEIIKKAFIKVLTGYYHSRIEYPNQKDE